MSGTRTLTWLLFIPTLSKVNLLKWRIFGHRFWKLFSLHHGSASVSLNKEIHHRISALALASRLAILVLVSKIMIRRKKLDVLSAVCEILLQTPTFLAQLLSFIGGREWGRQHTTCLNGAEIFLWVDSDAFGHYFRPFTSHSFFCTQVLHFLFLRV